MTRAEAASRRLGGEATLAPLVPMGFRMQLKPQISPPPQSVPVRSAGKFANAVDILSASSAEATGWPEPALDSTAIQRHPA